MKHLIRRLARVADSSSPYKILRSDTPRRPTSPVPQGHVPVYVGDELERFVVSAELLNHPVFVGLLDKSAQEYGYEHNGGLRIPCRVVVFQRVLEAVKLSGGKRGFELSTEFNDVLEW